MVSGKYWSAIAALIPQGVVGHSCLGWGAVPGVAVVDTLANERVVAIPRGEAQGRRLTTPKPRKGTLGGEGCITLELEQGSRATCSGEMQPSDRKSVV